MHPQSSPTPAERPWSFSSWLAAGAGDVQASRETRKRLLFGATSILGSKRKEIMDLDEHSWTLFCSAFELPR